MATSAIDTEPIAVFPFEVGRQAEPCLAKDQSLEIDYTGAEVRYEVFEKAWHRARTQLQELADGLYEPYCGQIAKKLDELRMGIPTVSVDASGSASFERLPKLIEKSGENTIHVLIHPVQCVNLSSCLKTFVMSVANEIIKNSGSEILGSLMDEYEMNDLTLLDAYLDTSHCLPIQLTLHGVEQIAPAPLNDFIQALQDWQHVSLLRIVFVYTAPLAVLPRERMPKKLHSPSSWLRSVFSAHICDRFDVVPFSLPDKSEFWTRCICPFFVSPESRLVLGRSVFELVRRRYWHVEASWENVLQTIRLCYLHHVSTQPLSAFLYTIPDENNFPQHWTPEMADALRLAAVAPYAAKNQAPSDKVRHLLKDTRTLLEALTECRNDLARWEASRIVALTTVQLLLEQTQTANMNGTRLSFSACLATSLILDAPFSDWDLGCSSAYAMTLSTPNAQQLCALLRHLASTLSVLETRLLAEHLLTKFQACSANFEQAGAAVMETSGAALHNLLHNPQERYPELFAQWLVDCWNAMLDRPVNGLMTSIWTYDYAQPISAVLEGAARSSILLALDKPNQTVASMMAASIYASGSGLSDPHSDWPERAMGVSDLDELRAALAETRDAEVPDVCRLYALYKDSGKFINLADWYDAFLLSLEVDLRYTSQDMDQDASQYQMRFALAINELAYLGLLAPTGRKVEHLCRTVWDLPIEGMPETT
ncbi:Origin recognition complex subunit 3 [Malassezia yamatoensis]|uniref:Origin recognition complex subunit 3 n=1 Tax=Malassezia yamatoensis TaxID=253288 RepID=A0AAJ6CH67_9BASI|nr:Origin recognition complex subunit 3 [Malassezia yamatoensis]